MTSPVKAHPLHVRLHATVLIEDWCSWFRSCHSANVPPPGSAESILIYPVCLGCVLFLTVTSSSSLPDVESVLRSMTGVDSLILPCPFSEMPSGIGPFALQLLSEHPRCLFGHRGNQICVCLEPCRHHLGMKITRNQPARTINLTQTGYIEWVFSDAHNGDLPVNDDSHGVRGDTKANDDHTATEEDRTAYKSALGSPTDTTTQMPPEKVFSLSKLA